MARIPAGLAEQIADEALRRAIGDTCRGGSWRGLARGLAWRVVVAGDRYSRSIETLAGAPEAIFAAEIDEALWRIERVTLQAWEEFLEARPEDGQGALAAARLDANEESIRLVEQACARVVEMLLAGSRRAA